MIEARVYRAAFIPALLALVLAMFSFQSRPAPLPQGLAADILFDGSEAAALAERIATEQPDRRAGGPGDAATAELVANEFARRGFQPDQIERQRFTGLGRHGDHAGQAPALLLTSDPYKTRPAFPGMIPQVSS